MYNNDNTGSILGGLFLAGVLGVAAVAAAAADDSTSSASTIGARTSSYPITTPPRRTQPLRPEYDRGTSYNPVTGRVTERRDMRVDPRAYEVRPDYYRDPAAMTLIQRESAIFSTMSYYFGYLDDAQITSIAKYMMRLSRNESLFVYKHMGRIYMVSTETLKGDRNAANQLHDFFAANRSMRVLKVMNLGGFYTTTNYTAGTLSVMI